MVSVRVACQRTSPERMRSANPLSGMMASAKKTSERKSGALPSVRRIQPSVRSSRMSVSTTSGSWAIATSSRWCRSCTDGSTRISRCVPNGERKKVLANECSDQNSMHRSGACRGGRTVEG